MRESQSLFMLGAIAVVGRVPTFAQPCENQQNDFCELPLAGEALLGQYPGLLHHCDCVTFINTGGIRTFYATSMTTGVTPDEAVQNWIDAHSDAFTGIPMDLVRQRETDLDSGKFTVFLFQEYSDEVPVEGNFVRLLVRNGSPDRVVYASAYLAAPLESPFARAPFTIDASEALQIVQQTSPYDQLNEWGNPELVLFGWGDVTLSPPVPSWKFFGRRITPTPAEGYTFFVSAYSGSILYARDDVHELDAVDGNVQGLASPASKGGGPPARFELAC